MMKRNEKQEKRFLALATKMGLTVEDAESICGCALATWDYIGYDCLMTNDGKDIPRAEVIECVMDADHTVTRGGLMLTVAAKAVIRSYDYSDPIAKLLTEFAFPYSRYGM